MSKRLYLWMTPTTVNPLHFVVKQNNFLIQVALVIRGLFICEFAYSRLWKIYQTSIYANFQFTILACVQFSIDSTNFCNYIWLFFFLSRDNISANLIFDIRKKIYIFLSFSLDYWPLSIEHILFYILKWLLNYSEEVSIQKRGKTQKMFA